MEPAALLFDISIFIKILAKHQLISIIVLVGPGLGIALCWQFFPLVLLTWYLVCWGSELVTVERASLSYLVWSRHRWKLLSCIYIYRDLQSKTILWFDMCGWLALCCQFFLLHFWLGILSVEGLHVWLLGSLVYLPLFGIETVEKKLRCRLNIQKLTK